MRRLTTVDRLRRPAVALVAVALVVALVLQRQTVIDAGAQLRSLSGRALMVLALLAVLDRLLRAELIRSLLPRISLARAEAIGDIGAAATKGLPFGGPLGTVLRWQLVRERGVGAVGFLTMLVASGVAAAFASWGSALGATGLDIRNRQADAADLIIIGVCVVVLSGAVAFWAVLLHWEPAHRWTVNRSAGICQRLTGLVPTLAEADPAEVVTGLRRSLRVIARRPGPLLVRTLVAQGNGALILWVALQSVGVGPELGGTEFARVFFVTHVIGSFAPTPGGVGLIEVGLTGALVAAGADPASALAGVLIYRLITYVLPIAIGTVLYLVWQRRRSTDARPLGELPEGGRIVHL
jgi:uncharacterized membrane protein YbhN (UPF0104 family)